MLVDKEGVGEGEQAVLRQVDRQGHILILEDGRMLRVAPSDATLAPCGESKINAHIPLGTPTRLPLSRPTWSEEDT